MKVTGAAKFGENVLAAVKPIERALRDLDSRVAELQARASADDAIAAELGSPVQIEEQSSQGNTPAANDDDARLQDLERRMKTMSGRLPTSRRSATIAVVEARLAQIQVDMDRLFRRVEAAEKGRNDVPLAASLASVKAALEAMVQQVSGLEKRFLSRLGTLEARLNSTAISVNLRPITDGKHTTEKTAPPTSALSVSPPAVDESKVPLLASDNSNIPPASGAVSQVTPPSREEFKASPSTTEDSKLFAPAKEESTVAPPRSHESDVPLPEASKDFQSCAAGER